MCDEKGPIEYQLLRDGTLFDDLEIIDTKLVATTDNEDWAVTIEFKVDEDLVESCAFGIVYVLGLLSFHDGRPRGVSGKWFEDDDEVHRRGHAPPPQVRAGAALDVRRLPPWPVHEDRRGGLERWHRPPEDREPRPGSDPLGRSAARQEVSPAVEAT